MITGIEGRLQQFSFNPTNFFLGPMAAAQIDAYHFCFNGLKELDEYAVKCFNSCAPHFAVLDKVTWQLNAVESKHMELQ